MKCNMAMERINSPVADRSSAWDTWRVNRHCARCAACRTRREQAGVLAAGLRALASAPTPERVRASLFAQMPVVSASHAHTNMLVSLGMEPGARRRRILQRVIGAGGTAAICGTTALLIAPRVLPGFPTLPNLIYAVRNDLRDLQEQQAAEPSFNVPQPDASLLAKCRTLRGLWKPWALTHAPLLKQMLRGDKQGGEAMLRVFEEMPAELPGKGNGLTYQTLGANRIRFSWQPAMKLGMTFLYNPQSPRHHASERRFDASGQQVSVAYDADTPAPELTRSGMEDWGRNERRILSGLRRKYDNFHDVEVSRSLVTGLTGYSLWASGRITRTEWQGRDCTIRDLAPPYEEITRTK